MASLTEEERAIDPYRVLGIEVTATESEVKKAYRKRSLKCHPDKNPTPEAAEEFHRISLALGILTTPGKRAFLDKKLEQTRAAEARRAEMDAKRKVKVDDLLRREEDAKRVRMDAQEAAREKLKEAEIREAGKRLLEERRAQAAALRQPRPQPVSSATPAGPPPIGPSDLTILLIVPVPAPSADELKARLGEKYGKIADVFVSAPKEGKKKARAIVEFAPGNWGGCWTCLKDAGGVPGAKAKWVGDEPHWVKWAETHGSSSASAPHAANEAAASPDGHAQAAPTSNEKQASSNGSSKAYSPSPASFPTFTSAPSFSFDPASKGSFPDIAELTASHARRVQDERAAQAQLAAANESATLLRMRQRERERKELEARIRAEEEAE